jgi:hypothetical protein
MKWGMFLLSLSAVLFHTSCQQYNLPTRRKAPVVVNTPLDTIEHNRYEVSAKPAIFETAFFLGTRVDEMTFYGVNIGKLKIESGKIIACDPVGLPNAYSLALTFPTGEFPLQLAIEVDSIDQRVAYSRILFSEKPVARWEVALFPGQKPLPVDTPLYHGYGVDSGTGCFLDSLANVELDTLSKKDEEIWNHMFFDSMAIHYRNTWSYALPSFKGHNLSVFSTGTGDGLYPTYVAYDADGKICRLLTDFGLVNWVTKK